MPLWLFISGLCSPAFLLYTRRSILKNTIVHIENFLLRKCYKNLLGSIWSQSLADKGFMYDLVYFNIVAFMVLPMV